MRAVALTVLVALVLALGAANTARLSAFLPYEGRNNGVRTQPETLWTHLVDVSSIFLGEIAAGQTETYWHRGIEDEAISNEFNVFRPYDPARFFSVPDTQEHHSPDAGEMCTHEERKVHAIIPRQDQLLPLYGIAATLNPADETNWALGAYIMARIHRTNDAVDFIEEGVRKNPTSAYLRLELATHLFHADRRASYPRITNLLESVRPALTETTDMRRALTYLGNVYGQMHCTSALVRLEKEWNALFPGVHRPDTWNMPGI